MKHLLNAMRRQAELVMGALAGVRSGIVSSYDPGNYSAKVRIMPENRETGWLPIVSPWIGNGWGLFAPPSVGDAVEVQFHEDDAEAGYVGQRFFNDSDRPLNVPSGEFWLVHKSGSLFKFHNDGSVEMQAATNLTASAPNGTLRLAGKDVRVHGTNSFRFDVNGHGQHWKPTSIDAYQTGESGNTSNPITAPEIP